MVDEFRRTGAPLYMSCGGSNKNSPLSGHGKRESGVGSISGCLSDGETQIEMANRNKLK